MTAGQRSDYGFARVRDAAYDAVMELWRRRKSEGMTQAQLAEALGGDSGWLSRNLKGPGNWTLKTVGRLVEALVGEVEIKVHALEDSAGANYHAYVGYESPLIVTRPDMAAKDVKQATASSKKAAHNLQHMVAADLIS
jgi:transcriptional regulator with XRE-family HTH domain